MTVDTNRINEFVKMFDAAEKEEKPQDAVSAVHISIFKNNKDRYDNIAYLAAAVWQKLQEHINDKNAQMMFVYGAIATNIEHFVFTNFDSTQLHFYNRLLDGDSDKASTYGGAALAC